MRPAAEFNQAEGRENQYKTGLSVVGSNIE